MKLQDAVRDGVKDLQAADITDASIDAWYLMESLTRISKMEFYKNPDQTLSEEILRQYIQLIEKRKKHVPLQYLTQEQEFMGYSFYVDERVLIPRQDTETLVLEAEQWVKEDSRVLDICTGSGCIALSLKLRHESIMMTAADISAEALQVAEKNAARLNAVIDFYQSDLFENIPKSRYDVIVSNPPYIESSEIECLMEEVRLYEPRLALDGECDGLDFYRKIIESAPAYLNEHGRLLFEIGYQQAEAVSKLMHRRGFVDIKVIKDLSGLDRVVSGGIEYV